MSKTKNKKKFIYLYLLNALFFHLDFITIWARYKQVKFYIEKYFNNVGIGISQRLKRNNRYFAIFGCGYSLGVMILGNFRNTEQPIEHGVGFVVMTCILGEIFFQVNFLFYLQFNI